MFKKIDRFFVTLFSPVFVNRLEETEKFLLTLKEKDLTIDDGLAILKKLLEEERKTNILV